MNNTTVTKKMIDWFSIHTNHLKIIQMELTHDEINSLIIDHGFRSFLDAKYQSWNSFTMQLFGGDHLRGEFDRAEFYFDLDSGKETQMESETDDDSLEAAYFGRPIQVTRFHFPTTSDLKHRLQLISGVLNTLFKEKAKISRPQLLISEIKQNCIFAYYIWQYRSDS